jgi:hypothetical protein
MKAHYAYNELPEMEAVMRLQAVKRWHMIETSRTQTLAEHSANVALLVFAIARTTPGAYFRTELSTIIALMHDLGESFLGDVPTPTKRLMGRDKMNGLELQVLPSCFSQVVSSGSEREALLIKICDLADGIRFIRLHGVDQTAVWAREGIEEQLTAKLDRAKLEWPEPVYHHVRYRMMFYAYEKTGNGSTATLGRWNEGPVAPDMA